MDDSRKFSFDATGKLVYNGQGYEKLLCNGQPMTTPNKPFLV